MYIAKYKYYPVRGVHIFFRVGVVTQLFNESQLSMSMGHLSVVKMRCFKLNNFINMCSHNKVDAKFVH